MIRDSWLLSFILPSLSLAAASAPILLQDARLVSSSVWNFHRNLGNRIEAFEGENLICQVTEGEQQDEELVSIDFDFWYAMGVDHPLEMMDILKLEHQLFQTIQDNLLWCWSDGDTLVEARGHNNSVRLLKDAGMAKRRFTTEARNLGIVAFSVGGLDEQTDRKSTLSFALSILSCLYLISSIYFSGVS